VPLLLLLKISSPSPQINPTFTALSQYLISIQRHQATTTASASAVTFSCPCAM